MPEMVPDRIKVEFLDQMKYVEEFGCACSFSSVCFSMLIIEIVVSRLQRQVGRPQSTATRSETTYLGRICQSYRLEQNFGVMGSYYTLRWTR